MSSSESEHEPIPPSKQMHSLRICEEEKVKSYLDDRLLLLQQQALKRIAKAWIKGICPKKQARFPYQNRQRLNDTGLSPETPEWWPQEGCRFTEPDHIDKNGKFKPL